jgi:hypothetical protein
MKRRKNRARMEKELERLRERAQQLKEKRPGYGEILDFLRQGQGGANHIQGLSEAGSDEKKEGIEGFFEGRWPLTGSRR